jgi:hypothetical protein
MIRPTSYLLLCLALAACARETSPEDEIRAVVAAAEEAAESRDTSALFDLVAPDYQDARGNAAEEIRRYVRGYLVTHQSIHLLTRVDEIEILASDLARLRATVGMLGREAGAESSWDLAGDVYEFDVTLAREEGEWLVTRAAWRRGGLTD